MAAPYANAKKPAKSANEDVFGKSRKDLRWFMPVVKAFKVRFPHDTAAELAYRAKTSNRSAETWMSGRGAPEGAALHALQNSDLGDLVWKAMTAGNNQPWAKKLRRQIEISEILDQQIELDLRLKALQRGDQ